MSAAGLLLELLLLEHWDSPWQWVPLALLAATLALGVALLRAATPARVRGFRALSLLCIVGGALGVWMHLDGNVAFEREMSAELRGRALLWAAVRGATPLLAPGALLQVGLVALLFAHRHPALRRPGDAAPSSPHP